MLLERILSQQNAAHFVEQHVISQLKILPAQLLVPWKNPHLALGSFAFDFGI